MEISGLPHDAPAPFAPATIPAERLAEEREIVQAVKALNGAEMFGHENQLMFQRDSQTQRMVIRMVDRRTNEVVAQIPSEHVLRMAEDLKKASK